MHLKQKIAGNARKKVRALFWGNRVGKTEFGAMEVARVLQGKHKFIAGGDVWAFCPSFDEQKDTTQEKLLRYIPEHAIVDRIWLRKGILKELVVRGDDGANHKVTFKSYEQGREKAQGAGKTLVWFDEEPPKDIFDECSVRVAAGIPLYFLMTMTPIKGMTWVYNEIYLNSSNPDIFISEASWKDNPWLTQEQIAEMERRLTPQALKVRREGKFMKQVGLVASWFQRDIHVIDMEGKLPPGQTYFGIDFGFSNPCCGLYVRVDRDGNLWVFDGWYRRGLINPDMQALMALKDPGLGRITRIGDGAGASDIATLNLAGYPIVAVEKESGTNGESWDEYRAGLMEQYGRIQEATNMPKIFISSTLTDIDDDPKSPTVGSHFNFLMKELENLTWEEMKTPDGVQQKAIWGKKPNHAIDALTYIIATIVPKTYKKRSGGIGTDAGLGGGGVSNYYSGLPG